MPPTSPYPSVANSSTTASRLPTSNDTLRRPSSLAIAVGDPGTWSGVTKLASSSRDPPSGQGPCKVSFARSDLRLCRPAAGVRPPESPLCLDLHGQHLTPAQ